jgi:uncharacterized delta-60 repeat protein
LTHFGPIDGEATGVGIDFAELGALQADGKLVVAGESFTVSDFRLRLALARYNPDGSLDRGFGSGGRVLTQLRDEDEESLEESLLALVTQPDGKLLVGSGFFVFNELDPSASRCGVSLQRFNSDGSTDLSFGAGGRVNFEISRSFSDLACGFSLRVLPDGKAVVGATASSGPPDNPNRDFALLRLNADGSLDTTFGSGGRVVIDFAEDPVAAPRSDFINDLIIQPDGKLIALGGSSNVVDFVSKAALARFNADGSLDTSFGSDGRLLLGLGVDTAISTPTLQPDGRLLAVITNFDIEFRSFLARFNTDGSLDASFGSGGLAQITLSGFFFASGLAVQSDGKLVLAGEVFVPVLNNNLFSLARFNADGSVDTGFGSGGQVLTSFDGRSLASFASANGVIVQPDGRLVVVGSSNAAGDQDFALARYLLGNERPATPPRCGGRPATVIGTPGDDTLRGTLFGSDVILGLGGNDTIRGLGAEDVLCGGRGNDVLIGGDESDRLFGGPGNDRLFGDLGLDGVDGGDFLSGGPGRDTLVGAGGSDTLLGERDNDRLFGDAGLDALDGGDGERDRCRSGLGRDTIAGCEFGQVQRPIEPPRDPIPPCPPTSSPTGCGQAQ